MTIHNSKGLEFPICYFLGFDNTFNIDETKDINVKFPEDYFSKDLAGKEVYLGILHFTMDDQGTIMVDNVKLTDGLLTPVENLVATENENDVNISWTWADEDSKEPIGYKVYRAKDNKTESAVMIADNVTEMTYNDAQWNELEWGIYQWGVAALYEQETRGTAEAETIFEEVKEILND